MRTDQFSNDCHTAHISSTGILYYLHSYQSLAMPLKGRDTPADRPRNELEEEEETVQILQCSQYQVHHSGTAARPGPNGKVGDDCEFGSVEEDGDEDAGPPPTNRRRVPQQLSRQFTDEEEDALIEFWSSTPMLYDRRHNDLKRNETWKNMWCNIGRVDSSVTGSLLKQFLQDQLFIHPRSLTQRSWKRREVVRESYDGRVSVLYSRDGRAQVVDLSRKSWGRRTTVVQRSLQSVVKESRRSRAAVTAAQSIIKVTEQSTCFGHGVHGAPCDWDTSRTDKRGKHFTLCFNFFDATIRPMLPMLLWRFPSSGVAGMVLNTIIPLCPVQYGLLIWPHNFHITGVSNILLCTCPYGYNAYEIGTSRVDIFLHSCTNAYLWTIVVCDTSYPYAYQFSLFCDLLCHRCYFYWSCHMFVSDFIFLIDSTIHCSILTSRTSSLIPRCIVVDNVSHSRCPIQQC